jgi:hypothetical protein
LRSFLAVFIGIVFVLSVILANLSVWILRSILDDEAFVTTVGTTMDGPAVRTAIGGYLADVVVDVLDTRAPNLRASIGSNFGLNGTPSSGQLKEALTPFIAGLLTDPRLKAARDDVLREVHATLVHGTPGARGVVAIQGTQLVVDLRPLVVLVGAVLPGGAISEGSLPADAARLTVADWPGFATLASTVQVLTALQLVIPVVVVALGLLLILDARRKLRALAFVCVGIAIGGLVGLGVVGMVGPTVAAGVRQPALSAAVRDGFNGFTTQLAQQSLLVAAIGLLAAILFMTLHASRAAARGSGRSGAVPVR